MVFMAAAWLTSTPFGSPVEPEVPVCITPIVGEDYMVYRDLGIPIATDIMTWQGGAGFFNGAHVTNNAPEGSQTFLVDAASWAGWGWDCPCPRTSSGPWAGSWSFIRAPARGPWPP